MKSSVVRIAFLFVAHTPWAMTSSNAGPMSNVFPLTQNNGGYSQIISATGGGNGDLIALFMSGSGFYVQRFDGLGNHLDASDLYVAPSNAYAVPLSVGAARNGDFSTAWYDIDGTGKSVYFKAFTRSGALRYGPVKANVTPYFSVQNTRHATNELGESVVYWQTADVAGGPSTLRARTFSASGAPISGEFVVAPAQPNVQLTSVAIDRNGNLTFVWGKYDSTPSGYEVVYRQFNRTGTALTAATPANTFAAGQQYPGAVATNRSGNTVIVWCSVNQDGDQGGIYAQRVDASGVKVGPEFRVNSITAGNQAVPVVGVADDGSFAVAWTQANSGTVNNTVMVRQFLATGVAVAPEEVVATASTSVDYPALGMEPGGRFLLSWWQRTSTGALQSQARLYAMDTAPISQLMYSGVAATNLSGSTGSMKYFKLNVPTGATQLNVAITGGTTGDADFYVRLGSVPGSLVDASSTKVGNNEGIQITGIPGGIWYVGLYGYAAYSGVNLTMTAR